MVPVAETVNERTFVSSVVATYAISDWTPLAGVGPIIVGVAHGDYSSAEIEQWIENSGSWNEGDKVNQEIAKRQIRQIGVLKTPALVTLDSNLNDGKPMKTKLNWILNQGQTLDYWVYNSGDVAFATTDPDLTIVGHANLWPQ